MPREWDRMDASLYWSWNNQKNEYNVMSNWQGQPMKCAPNPENFQTSNTKKKKKNKNDNERENGDEKKRMVSKIVKYKKRRRACIAYMEKHL